MDGDQNGAYPTNSRPPQSTLNHLLSTPSSYGPPPGQYYQYGLPGPMGGMFNPGIPSQPMLSMSQQHQSPGQSMMDMQSQQMDPWMQNYAHFNPNMSSYNSNSAMQPPAGLSQNSPGIKLPGMPTMPSQDIPPPSTPEPKPKPKKTRKKKESPAEPPPPGSPSPSSSMHAIQNMPETLPADPPVTPKKRNRSKKPKVDKSPSMEGLLEPSVNFPSSSSFTSPQQPALHGFLSNAPGGHWPEGMAPPWSIQHPSQSMEMSSQQILADPHAHMSSPSHSQHSSSSSQNLFGAGQPSRDFAFPAESPSSTPSPTKPKKKPKTKVAPTPVPGEGEDSSDGQAWMKPESSSHGSGSKSTAEKLGQLYEMGSEPDRKAFLDQLIKNCEEINTPMLNVPVISKTTLDLYKFYQFAKSRGGYIEIHRAKGWKEIASLLGIVSPNPNTAYTLKKQYIKFLLPFEARYERGGVDPQSIIEAAEAAPPIKPPSSRNRDRSGESKNKRPRSSVNAVKDQMEGLEGVPPGPQGAFMQQQQQQQQPGLVQGGPYGQMRPGQGQPGMVPGPGEMGGPGPQGPGGMFWGPQGQMQIQGPPMGQEGGPVGDPYAEQMRYHQQQQQMQQMQAQQLQQQQQQQEDLLQPRHPQQSMQNRNAGDVVQPSYVGGTRGFTDNGPEISAGGGGGVGEERRAMDGNLSSQFMPHAPAQAQQQQAGQGIIGPQDNRHASSSFSAGSGPNTHPHQHNVVPSIPMQHGGMHPHHAGQRLMFSPGKDARMVGPIGSIVPQGPHQMRFAGPQPPPQQQPQMPMLPVAAAQPLVPPISQPPEFNFPPDSVEATEIQMRNRQRYSIRDFGGTNVEIRKLFMRLKSGLLAESSWAFEMLNIYTCDDHTSNYFNVSNLPAGFLDTVIDWLEVALGRLLMDSSSDSGENAIGQKCRMCTVNGNTGQNSVSTCPTCSHLQTHPQFSHDTSRIDKIKTEEGYNNNDESPNKRIKLNEEHCSPIKKVELFEENEGPFFFNLKSECQEAIARKSVAISTSVRNLSAIAGNETIMAKHQRLLWLIGQFVTFNHSHSEEESVEFGQFKTTESENEIDATMNGGAEDEEGDVVVKIEEEVEKSVRGKADVGVKAVRVNPWWTETVEHVRENLLVTLANIAGHLDLSDSEEAVCRPVLEGLIHWTICPSSAAQDTLPSVLSQHLAGDLSARCLALEALSKMTVHDANMDLLIATPSGQVLCELVHQLIQLLPISHPWTATSQLNREFGLVILAGLVACDEKMVSILAEHTFGVEYLTMVLEEFSRMAKHGGKFEDSRYESPVPSQHSMLSIMMLRKIVEILVAVAENAKGAVRKYQMRLWTLITDCRLPDPVAVAGLTKIMYLQSMNENEVL